MCNEKNVNEVNDVVYDIYYVTTSICLRKDEKEYFEKCRDLLAERGMDVPFGKFLEMCMATGCLPHLKNNACIYAGGDVSNDSMPIL